MLESAKLTFLHLVLSETLSALRGAVKTSSVNKEEKQELHLWKSQPRNYSKFYLDLIQ